KGILRAVAHRGPYVFGNTYVVKSKGDGREEAAMTASGTAPGIETAVTQTTRDRLVDAISTHGPITARRLAEQFGLTSAAVRRHLAALEAEGVIAEHDLPIAPRGRGRPSKSFVLSPSAHEDLPGGYDELAVMAMDELARLGGSEAVTALAERR